MAYNTKIKSFFKDPNCSVCGGKVKGWARRQCDNCGSLVCARHRPTLVSYWECPACRNRQQQFLGAPEVGSQIAGPQAPHPMPDLRQWGYNPTADSHLDQMLRAAETLYNEGNDQAADRIAEKLLTELYHNEEAQD